MADQTATVQTETILSPEKRRQQFKELGWWVTIPLSVVPAHWFYDGEQRLDAGYYSREAIAASRLIQDCGFETKQLQEIVKEIFVLDRFRRVYASDKQFGWPYLSSSEVLDFRPISERYIAKDHAPKGHEHHFAREGWILVTASGSVGRPVVATKRLEKFFLTHDLIRILSSESVPFGYIYAFLSSGIGQSLISKDQYGSAIKHLEPHHISSVPVPLFPENEQQAIHIEIVRAFKIRDEANELLDEADELLHQELDLSRFDEKRVDYFSISPRKDTVRPQIPHPKAFSTKASELEERLDASYHVPAAQTAIRVLRKGKYKLMKLGELTADIRVAPRFKRVYVEKQHGVPLLQGSHLPQMRPFNLKYISLTKQEGLDRWIINKGWVLVTCSGTIGRVGLVSSRLDKWAASQHLLRIIPSNDKGHPGFIAAFLMTPYGQHQLTSKIYGGVVDEITEKDTSNVWIPNAPIEIQRKIGELVVSAFEKRDEAAVIEEAAIQRVEVALQKAQ